MSMIPTASWYRDIVAAVERQQAGVVDYLGRPWAEHFQRVAIRLIFRRPDATRSQIEAALLHDVFMARGGGEDVLDRLGISDAAREMIRITTPPPDADYFRVFDQVGDRENAIYLDYISRLTTSGNIDAIEMKLADINDTIDACRTGRTEVLLDQYFKRYEPSRRLLERAVSPLFCP